MTDITVIDGEALTLVEETVHVSLVSASQQETTVVTECELITVVDGTALSIVEELTAVDLVSEQTTVTVVEGGVGPRGSDGLPGEAASFSAVNKSGAAASVGQAVAIYTTGMGFVLADASTSAAVCVGLLADATDPEAAGTIQTAGVFEMDDWSSVTGTPELAPRGVYYLDAQPGKLTTTPPGANPAIVQQVGKALMPTKLLIEIWAYIQL